MIIKEHEKNKFSTLGIIQQGVILSMVYTNKRDWILGFVHNKKVLDLGCLDNSLVNIQTDKWLHGAIVKCARSVMGIDIQQKAINSPKQLGFEVIFADVEHLDLNDTFEIIVAGDLIEHLSNPGIFIDRVSEHLASDGIFLITTPNPSSLIRFFQLLFLGRMDVNLQHTCWFTPEVIAELSRRGHLQVIDVVYIDDENIYNNQCFPSRSIFVWPALIINYLFCRIRPLFSESLGFVLQHTSKDKRQNNLPSEL
jgi:2-polyprenyl-3-methyl-5-hydroxy-6-metoxy-1,4-benzoquinol methylase